MKKLSCGDGRENDIMVSVLVVFQDSRDLRFSIYWLSGFGIISDGMVGARRSISPLKIEPMHLSVEGFDPSLRLVVPSVAVSPGAFLRL